MTYIVCCLPVPHRRCVCQGRSWRPWSHDLRTGWLLRRRPCCGWGPHLIVATLWSGYLVLAHLTGFCGSVVTGAQPPVCATVHSHSGSHFTLDASHSKTSALPTSTHVQPVVVPSWAYPPSHTSHSFPTPAPHDRDLFWHHADGAADRRRVTPPARQSEWRCRSVGRPPRVALAPRTPRALHRRGCGLWAPDGRHWGRLLWGGFDAGYFSGTSQGLSYALNALDCCHNWCHLLNALLVAGAAMVLYAVTALLFHGFLVPGYCPFRVQCRPSQHPTTSHSMLVAKQPSAPTTPTLT